MNAILNDPRWRHLNDDGHEYWERKTSAGALIIFDSFPYWQVLYSLGDGPTSPGSPWYTLDAAYSNANEIAEELDV